MADTTIEFIPLPDSSDTFAAASEVHAEVRALTLDEIQTLSPVFEQYGAIPPNPQSSVVVGAIKDGEVVGFLVLQLTVHAEPMWIKDGHSQVFQSLVSKSEEVVAQNGGAVVYLFTPAGRTSQLAQLCGMQIEPWVVHSKVVPGQISNLDNSPADVENVDVAVADPTACETVYSTSDDPVEELIQ